MPVNYIDFDQAKDQQGLRMVVMPGLPSPWSESAKGILHIKQIPWHGVRLDQRNDEMAQWTGVRNAPVAIYNKETPKTDWVSILLLAEHLSSEPSLLPKKPKSRALALGLCHEICGEMGLGWSRRLDIVHRGLNGQGGFPEPIAQYLGKKYGYRKELGLEYSNRVVELLTMLAEQLHKQREAGERFYFGGQLSAVDIYSACFMACFKPLSEDMCSMDKVMRTVFESMSHSISRALDPILIEHRDFVYENYLELPLTL